MAANPDFKELLRTFNEKGIEYLIVGGYAVMKYTEPRFTKDIDVWVRNSEANAAKAYRSTNHKSPLTNHAVRFPHSCLSASIGATRIARRAGT